MRRALWWRRLALKQSSSLLGFDFVVWACIGWVSIYLIIKWLLVAQAQLCHPQMLPLGTQVVSSRPHTSCTSCSLHPFVPFAPLARHGQVSSWSRMARRLQHSCQGWLSPCSVVQPTIAPRDVFWMSWSSWLSFPWRRGMIVFCHWNRAGYLLMYVLYTSSESVLVLMASCWNSE